MGVVVADVFLRLLDFVEPLSGGDPGGLGIQHGLDRPGCGPETSSRRLDPPGATARLWIIFLPNSCYLFTESRHLFQAVEHEALWTRARHEPSIAIRLALGGAVALLYCSAGAMTFALVDPAGQHLAPRDGRPDGPVGAPLLPAGFAGSVPGAGGSVQFLGPLTRPDVVLETVAGIADRPLLLATLMLFAFFLWVTYELNDIWIDGFQLRWQRWTQRPPGLANAIDEKRMEHPRRSASSNLQRRRLADRQSCFADHGYQEEPQLFLRKMFHDGENRVQ